MKKLFLTEEEVRRQFTYQPPTTARKLVHQEIDRLFRETALKLHAITPDCADRTAAMRALGAARMAFNQSVACYTGLITEMQHEGDKVVVTYSD